MRRKLTTILLLTVVPLCSFAATTSLTDKHIDTNDGVFQTDLSPAVLGNKRFTGSGVMEAIFTSTLTAAGTSTDLAQYYSEPDATDITTYVVKPGDTLDSIAKLFRVSRNTIRWQNDLKRGDKIHTGMNLIILPITGIMYKVQKGDTLAKIAKQFGGTVGDIMQFNDIAGNNELVVGSQIIIPNGERDEEAPVAKKPTTILGKIAKILSKPFVRGRWNDHDMIVNGYMHPTRFAGIKTQGYHHEWRAIDIGVPVGTPLYASMAGRVKIANKSGYGGGYGHYVYIEHPNGSSTMYGHMSTVYVSPGEHVDQGDVIGLSGNTGSSTGPHVHFEIRPPHGKNIFTWFPIPW